MRPFYSLLIFFWVTSGAGPIAAWAQPTVVGNHTVYWSEDWENGQGLWSSSAGVWEVGSPTYGTSECPGLKCAATVLNANYPYGTNSRLESPPIPLPTSPSNDVLWLGLWHWFNTSEYNGLDYGKIQIWNAADGWTDVSGQFVRDSMVWTPFYADLTQFAGQTIKVGFLFADVHTGSTAYTDPGWMVDEISIFDGLFPVPTQITSFEESIDMDWDGWYPDQGVWELGTPTAGISHASSGSRCFGTNLSGEYPHLGYSRLMSPRFRLDAAPVDGKLYFSFKQWCSLSQYNGFDLGLVQINDGSGWQTLRTLDWHNNIGDRWVELVFDISSFAGQDVQLGFVIDDNRTGSPSYLSYGWYIDDIQFSEGARFIGNPERFENFASSWRTTNGVWEVGTPTSGPMAAHSGTRCWGTNLSGNYHYGAIDTLVTPDITLNNAPGLYMRFQHWFSFSEYVGIDYGVVLIRPQHGSWSRISDPFTRTSDWSQYTFDLSGYVGQTVQFGFAFEDIRLSGDPYQSAGWYIDDFEIVGMPQTEAPESPVMFNTRISDGPAELVFPHALGDIARVVIYGSPVDGFTPSLGNRLVMLPPSAMTWTDVDRPGWPPIYYRVSVVDIFGNESVPILAARPISQVGNDLPLPQLLQMSRVSPNPFNPSTVIRFQLSRRAEIQVEVFDMSGRRVARLLNSWLESGHHQVPFSAKELPSGVYFTQVRADGEVRTQKMLLLK
ncbi:MAG: choice-of-anchor J domain-containing protein [bacterium]|nr:choice-of-anchor J domain-containing protein [bacterium]